MTLDHLAEKARRFTELLDHHEWEAVDRHVAAEVRAHVGSQDLDKAAWLQMGRAFYGAFPDGAHEIERQIAQGDTVVTIARWTGTHRGELMGIPPSQRRVSMAIILVDRFRDGQIVEHWGQFDSAGLLQQLTAPAA